MLFHLGTSTRGNCMVSSFVRLNLLYFITHLVYFILENTLGIHNCLAYQTHSEILATLQISFSFYVKVNIWFFNNCCLRYCLIPNLLGYLLIENMSCWLKTINYNLYHQLVQDSLVLYLCDKWSWIIALSYEFLSDFLIGFVWFWAL